MSGTMRALVIVNCAAVAGTVALVLGLWAMGAGGWSFFGLAVLFGTASGSSGRGVERVGGDR